jgi:hypothetical protein
MNIWTDIGIIGHGLSAGTGAVRLSVPVPVPGSLVLLLFEYQYWYSEIVGAGTDAGIGNLLSYYSGILGISTGIDGFTTIYFEYVCGGGGV